MAGAVIVRQRNQLEYFMAQYQEFTFDQGTNTSIELHLVDANGAAKNLSGHSLTSKIKKTFNSDSSETTSFATQITNASGGIATLSLTNAQTNALKSGRHVYDIELSHVDSATSATIIERVLEGRIQVTPSVTK